MVNPRRGSGESASEADLLRGDPLARSGTLIDVVHGRASLTPTAEAFRFADAPCSFAKLAATVERVARALRARGVLAGDRVILVSPNCGEFFALFYGIQHLRAAAVPLAHASSVAWIEAAAEDCGACMIVATEPLGGERHSLVEAALPGVPIVDANVLLAPEAGRDRRLLPMPEADDLAMLHYTSGTAEEAKGVKLTHRALVANIRRWIPRVKITGADIIVNSLSICRDAGLVMMTMCPLYVGAPMVLLPVSLKPSAWLEAIVRHRGAVTAMPDLAYRYRGRRSRPRHWHRHWHFR